MQIDQNIIDDIIRKTDIVEYIGKNLKIKRSGSNYFACCPFHKEKSASFAINANKQFFHCFGCGESGDVITFTMKYYGLSFIDAVKSLAQNAGIFIPDNGPKLSKEEIVKQKEERQNLAQVIISTVNFYRSNLPKSSIASHYLANRGLDQKIIDKFLLGYVPNTTNSLSTVFSDYATNQFLVEAGLTIKNDNGSIYERFRDRIMFPIRNTKGDVIGFGGRIIAHGEPKYLNSPETTLFNKSHELYGLFESGKEIRNKNYVIVVEGYMDVIALFQYGIDNVVATMGTSATAEHITRLFHLCDDIYYCFDGDAAGRKAAWRALERSLPIVTDSKSVHFLFLPDDDDPDSFIRKKGVNVFLDQLKNHSMSMSNFLLGQLALATNTMTNEGKAKLISQAKPYFEQIKAHALQVMLKQQLAAIVELPPNALESILNNRSRYAFYSKDLVKHSQQGKKLSLPVINSINLIIANLLQNPGLVVNYKLPEIEEFEKLSSEIQELVLLIDFIANNYSEGDVIALDEIELSLPTFNLKQILAKNTEVKINHHECHEMLDRLLGRSKAKAIRIPRITLKSKS